MKRSFWRSSPWLVLLFFMLFMLPVLSIALAESAGWALSFNGVTNYVALGDNGALMGSADWLSSKTIESWVRVTGTTPPAASPYDGEFIILVDRPHLYGLSRAVYKGQDRLWAWNADASFPDAVAIPFTLNTWTHIAIVHSAGVLSVYKDGSLAGSVPSGPTYLPYPGANGWLYLGGYNSTNPAQFFAGELDEVRFWSAAINPVTLAAWYNRPLDTSHPNYSSLRAYYSASDGSGLTLSDDGPASFTGSLLGGMGDSSWVPSGDFLQAAQATASPTGTLTPTPTTTPIGTATITPTPTRTSTETATRTLSPTFTHTATCTAASSSTSIPSATPSRTPTRTPTGAPAGTSTGTPTRTPTSTPPPSPTTSPTPGASPILVEVGLYDTPGTAHDIAIQGSIAYVTDVNGGLRIVDLSDPSHPQPIGSYKTRTQAAGIAVQGSLAYVTDALYGLYILDISTPSSPVFLSSLDTPGYCWDVAVDGSTAYVVDRTGGLRIIDVSDPLHPVELSATLTPDEALDVVVSDGLAYVATYTQGFAIFDISNPSAPRLVSQTDTQRNYALRLYGSTLYLADGGNGLVIYDVSQPDLPRFIGRGDTPGWARSLRVDGAFAYVADWVNDLVVLDISDPAHPFMVFDNEMPGDSREVEIFGDYILVAAYTGGLRILHWY